MKIKDIQIVKIMMVRDKTMPYYSYTISNPKDVAKIGFKLFKGADREYFAVISLSRDNTINAINIASQGSLDFAIIHPREVFKFAILANAASICLLHNHPSLNVSPSAEDIAITRRLIEAAKMLKIEILDHVIIIEDDYYSLKVHSGAMFEKSEFYK